MTPHERATIVRLLTAEIEKNGPLELKYVPKCLAEGNIPPAVYSGPKKLLESSFPEFFVFGQHGYDAVDLSTSPLSTFYRMLQETVPLKNNPNLVGMDTILSLIGRSGLDVQEYGSVQGAKQLLRVYPTYLLVDGPTPVPSPDPDPVPGGHAAVAASELQFVHCVSFFNWKLILKKINQNAKDGPFTLETVREKMAHRFARAFLDGEGLWLDAMQDEQPRIVLSTGYETAAGELIFCILQPNVKENRKQAWMAAAVAYPNEPDEEGWGRWLAERIFPQAEVSVKALISRLQELEAMRQTLTAEVEGLCHALTDGTRPASVSGKLSRYEQLWDGLMEHVKQIPSLAGVNWSSLSDLEELLQQKNELSSLTRQAVALFTDVFHQTRGRLAILDAKMPQDDALRANGLFESDNISGDIRLLRDMLQPYLCLRQVLLAKERSQVAEQIGVVAAHFGMAKMDVLEYLVSGYTSKYDFLQAIDQIDGLLEECSRLSRAEKVEKAQQLDADELAREVFTRGTGMLDHWICHYRSLLPADEQLRSVILAEKDEPAGLTPGKIGARLMNFCGNRDRLAEKFLLLGLLTDRQICVQGLLRLYREAQDGQRFMELWNSGLCGTDLSTKDVCYWLSLRSADEDMNWDEIENFVARYPSVRDSAEYREAVLNRMSQLEQQPLAYRRWIGMGELKLNPLEQAVAANDTDAIYQLLENPTELAELGYDGELTAVIARAVAAGLPEGTDAYSRAVRLYYVQKNKNSAAECLLWTAPQTPQVLRLLFDIYSHDEDYESVFWLTQKFNVPIDNMQRTASYAAALVGTGQHELLAQLMGKHPELWHRAALLEVLEGEPWQSLYTRETASPMAALNPFAIALIEDNVPEMERLLRDPAQMAQWGYDGEMVALLAEKLEAGLASVGTDRVSVGKRFKYYQGNHLRNFENYLYRQFGTNPDWAVQHLFALAYTQGRYVDACAYFEAYPLLERADSNVNMYMWSLFHLERTEQLFTQAQLHPDSLRMDSELVKTVLNLANLVHKQDIAQNIQHMVVRLPQNAFEEAVMQYRHAELQRYVSDPDLLTALGYSSESIARFKDRISKPLPYGNEGYPLGIRMRLFFGNDRAIPFLEDALEDPRSAKLLMDIYYSAQRWDDVCALYTQQLPGGIWNATYEQRYIEALSKSHDPQRCQEYLQFLLGEANTDKSGAVFAWKYLRCMVGTGQEELAVQQMEQILQERVECAFDIALDTFDMVFETGSRELREKCALFAGRYYLAFMDCAPPDKLKAVLSLNGNLLRQADSQQWIRLFRENGLESVVTFLMCYFNFGVEGGTESLEATGDALFALLDSTDGQCENSILVAVTKFSIANSLLEGHDDGKMALLLQRWLDLVLTRDQDSGLLGVECLSEGEYAAFGGFWKTVELTAEQMEQVHRACLTDLENRGGYTAAFFQRLSLLLTKSQHHPDFMSQYAPLLMGAFASWLPAVAQTDDPEPIKAAAQFLDSVAMDYRQMNTLLEKCAECDLLYDPLLRDAILVRCEHLWPDLQYRYLQSLYFHSQQEEQKQEALKQARQLLHTDTVEPAADNDGVQFVYSIVSGNPTPVDLHLLYELYVKAGKTDQAKIILNLELANSDESDEAALCQWFHSMLEERSVEWLEYYSKWWAPLVWLREADNQTKSIISYLSNDDASMQYKESVLRLLLSDMRNPTYIGCYLRLEAGMSSVAAAKLTYIRALHDTAACMDAIRDCVAKKQYLYAVKLLTAKVSAVSANAVFIGQTLGDIYTAESLEICRELEEFVPDVFRHVIALNQADPVGAWKNIGRAVDIAILTNNEELFLDIFNREYQNMYFSYSGKCAALIANLLLRGEYAVAERYLQECRETNGRDPYQYMAMLGFITAECLQTGKLSQENEILVRSVPVSGNMRPLELYGTLVHYALSGQSIRACAEAFYKLRSFTTHDKALLGSCLQLYTVVSEDYSLSALYTLAKEYLEVVQDTLVLRSCKILALISACDGEQISAAQLVEDCGVRLQDSAALHSVSALRQKCCLFLEDMVDEAEKKRFLIRAATGWWSIDENVLGYYSRFPSLFEELAELFPSSFYSAVLSAVLRNREDPQLYARLLELFDMKTYKWGKEQAAQAAQYPAPLCASIARLLDAPMDLPGLYTSCLSQTLQEENEDLFIRQMTMLLVVQWNFLTKQYEENVCTLKEMSENCSISRQQAISRLFLRKTIATSGKVQLPRHYVDDGSYEMVIISAEKQLEVSDNPYLKQLNNAYLDLGRFMTEQSTSKKYTLGQLLNMATLLCQTKSYQDMEKLLAVCPAKWKLCLRCAQELVQGNPKNVLKLLENSDFQRHAWCHSFVYTMAKICSDSKTFQENMKKENNRKNRHYTWGRLDLKTLSLTPPMVKTYLLSAKVRNFAKLEPFDEFVRRQVEDMNIADQRGKNGRSEDAGREGEEITLPGVAGTQDESIWKIPFIADCLARYAPGQDSDEAENTAETSREEQKAALRGSLRDHPSDSELIDVYGKLLVLMRQEPVTAETKRHCVVLGLALYREKCEHRGMAMYPTEESRNILYSLVPCVEGLNAAQELSANLKVYLQECLVSYHNLSQFTADCMGSALLSLCSIIGKEDREAAKYLKRHIVLVRQIGEKMRQPMTNAERLEWLQSCINGCRFVEHPIEKRVKETLISMLTQEIMVFRNKAQIYLEVYNTECAAGGECIFGKVENLGGEAVTKLVLSLEVDGVFTEQYKLGTLSGLEMVPFALPCPSRENVDTLSYKLSLKYVTADGAEERTQPKEGTLTLTNGEGIRHRFQFYDASNPADSENYIERVSISNTLEANYLVDGGFKRFPNFAIYGMKRSGKSSALRRLGRLLDEHYEDTVRHVIVSCEGITGDFYTRAHCVFVKYVLDELDYKFGLQSMDGWQEFCNKWEALPENITEFRWLASFYTALNRQWFPNFSLVIMVDEIERLYFELGEDDSFLSEEAENFIPQGVDSSNAQSVLWDAINKMTQRDGSTVRFVLCGSDFFTSKIIAEGDNLTQFFQKGKKLNVDRMEYGEIEAALRANPSVTLTDDTVHYLWNIAAGLPWHSKIFCNTVIENQLIRREGSKRSVIYPSDIQDAIDRILSTTKDIASPANFGLLSLSSEENRIVQIMAAALDSRLARISLDDLMERLCQQCTEETSRELYVKALDSLVDERKLLKKDKERNYQFGCELYRMYLRHEIPSRFL